MQNSIVSFIIHVSLDIGVFVMTELTVFLLMVDLGATAEPVRAKDILEFSGYCRSTSYRAINNLSNFGYISKVEKGFYVINEQYSELFRRLI